MSLQEEINKGLTEAIKAREEHAVSALRQLKTAVMNIAKGRRTEDKDIVPDEAILNVVKTLVKQHKESIESFAGRDDLIAKEQAELEVLQSFLPPEVTSETLMPIVEMVIAKEGATSIKDMGKVMKAIKGALEGSGLSADGKLLSGLVREKLQ